MSLCSQAARHLYPALTAGLDILFQKKSDYQQAQSLRVAFQKRKEILTVKVFSHWIVYI